MEDVLPPEVSANLNRLVDLNKMLYGDDYFEGDLDST
jgi:hypothetical protein